MICTLFFCTVIVMGAILSLFSSAAPPSPQQAVEKRVADYGKSLDKKIAKRQKSIVASATQAKKQVEQESNAKQQAIEKTVKDPVVKKALQEETKKVQMFKTSLIAKRVKSDEKVRTAEQVKADAKKAALMQQLKLLQARRAEAIKRRQAIIAKSKAAREAATAAMAAASAQTPEQKAAAEKARKENEIAIAKAKKIEADANATRKEQEKKTAEAQKKLDDSIKKEQQAQRVAEEKDRKDRKKYDKQVSDAKSQADREISQGKNFESKGQADRRRIESGAKNASDRAAGSANRSSNAGKEWKIPGKKKIRFNPTEKRDLRKCKTARVLKMRGYMAKYCKKLTRKALSAGLLGNTFLNMVSRARIKGFESFLKKRRKDIRKRDKKLRKYKSILTRTDTTTLRRCKNRNYRRRNHRRCKRVLKKKRMDKKLRIQWKHNIKKFSKMYAPKAPKAQTGSPYVDPGFLKKCRSVRFRRKRGNGRKCYLAGRNGRKIARSCRKSRYFKRNRRKCKSILKVLRIRLPSFGSKRPSPPARPPPARKPPPKSAAQIRREARQRMAEANKKMREQMRAHMKKVQGRVGKGGRGRGRGRCFSGYTKVRMASGENKCIKDITLGEELKGGILVDATMQIKNRTNDPFYKIKSEILNGYVYVTGSHHILHGDKFIRVDEHPDAEITDNCDLVLYCLVTSTHIIPVGELTFWDWEDDLVNA